MENALEEVLDGGDDGELQVPSFASRASGVSQAFLAQPATAPKTSERSSDRRSRSRTTISSLKTLPVGSLGTTPQTSAKLNPFTVGYLCSESDIKRKCHASKGVSALSFCTEWKVDCPFASHAVGSYPRCKVMPGGIYNLKAGKATADFQSPQLMASDLRSDKEAPAVVMEWRQLSAWRDFINTRASGDSPNSLATDWQQDCFPSDDKDEMDVDALDDLAS